MYLCIFTVTVITVYKHDKQKPIVYQINITEIINVNSFAAHLCDPVWSVVT